MRAMARAVNKAARRVAYLPMHAAGNGTCHPSRTSGTGRKNEQPIVGGNYSDFAGIEDFIPNGVKKGLRRGDFA